MLCGRTPIATTCELSTEEGGVFASLTSRGGGGGGGEYGPLLAGGEGPFRFEGGGPSAGQKIFFGTARIVISTGDYPGERVAAAHPAHVAQTLPTSYTHPQIVRFTSQYKPSR